MISCPLQIDTAVAIAIAIATEAAAETAKQEDDKYDDEDESDGHSLISIGIGKQNLRVRFALIAFDRQCCGLHVAEAWHVSFPGLGEIFLGHQPEFSGRAKVHAAPR
jgi:hypothetical protein